MYMYMYSTCDDYYVFFIQVYNLVGVVRSHSDEEASMIEVEFHNTSTHHSFSLPNSSDYSMASLSEQALVLASEKQEEQSRLARLCVPHGPAASCYSFLLLYLHLLFVNCMFP